MQNIGVESTILVLYIMLLLVQHFLSPQSLQPVQSTLSGDIYPCTFSRGTTIPIKGLSDGLQVLKAQKCCANKVKVLPTRDHHSILHQQDEEFVCQTVAGHDLDRIYLGVIQLEGAQLALCSLLSGRNCQNINLYEEKITLQGDNQRTASQYSQIVDFPEFKIMSFLPPIWLSEDVLLLQRFLVCYSPPSNYSPSLQCSKFILLS